MHALLKDKIKLDRKHHDLLLLLAFTQLKFGLHEQAINIYDVLISIDPTNLYLTHAISKAYILSGKPESALRELEKINPIFSKDPLNWLLRGQALSQLGRRGEASACMRMFIHLRSTESER